MVGTEMFRPQLAVLGCALILGSRLMLLCGKIPCDRVLHQHLGASCVGRTSPSVLEEGLLWQRIECGAMNEHDNLSVDRRTFFGIFLAGMASFMIPLDGPKENRAASRQRERLKDQPWQTTMYSYDLSGHWTATIFHYDLATESTVQRFSY